MSKAQAMELLRLKIAEKLEEISDYCNSVSLPMTDSTLIIRDKSNPEMYLVISSETDLGLITAAHLALGQVGK